MAIGLDLSLSHLQLVGGNPSVGSHEAGFDSLRRLVGEFHGGLKKVDRECWVRFGSDPAAETGVSIGMRPHHQGPTHAHHLPCTRALPMGKRWNFVCTLVDNSQEYRLQNWATSSSVRSFARTAHSFACSGLLASLAPSAALTSLTPLLVGQCLIRLLFCLCFFLFSTIVA